MGTAGRNTAHQSATACDCGGIYSQKLRKACWLASDICGGGSSANSRGPLSFGSSSGSKEDMSNGSLLTTGTYGGWMLL
eukprot:5341648-Prymnesium_polylepis.1